MRHIESNNPDISVCNIDLEYGTANYTLPYQLYEMLNYTANEEDLAVCKKCLQVSICSFKLALKKVK